MKTAIVYDWIDKWGGVERLLLELHSLFPDAIFFTSYHDKKKAKWANKLTITQSFIASLPHFIQGSRTASLPFYPFAFESFDFEGYDVVLSVSSFFAKSVITRPGVKHINYLLSPPRYLWLYPELYYGKTMRSILSPALGYLRKWDLVASSRPDKILAISKTVADRCSSIYGRDASVVYPPFDAEYWIKEQNKHSTFVVPFTNFCLAVARLEQYKKIDLLLNVFRSLPNHHLVVVGTGSQEKKLKKIAPTNVVFVKGISDGELATLYSRAQCLIIPQEEDFGYTALEAQALGCPVLAYEKGGVTEIITHKTGLFFSHQSERSLKNALERLHTISYNLKKSAKEEGPRRVAFFSRSRFKSELFTHL